MANNVLFRAGVMAGVCALAGGLGACAKAAPEKIGQPVIGMANPASVFCIKQGGRLEIKRDADGGEYGLCHLPDGTVVDDWAYFRSQHKSES